MILVARAIQDFFMSRRFEARRQLENVNISHTRQLIIEHFFNMYAEWPWNGQTFEERAIYIVHPEAYMFQNHQTIDMNIRESIQASLGQAMTSNMAILSPSVPFRCIIPQMTLSCRNKIIKEFQVAQRIIYLAKSRFPEPIWNCYSGKRAIQFETDSHHSKDKLLKDKWSDLFFPSTVVNETNYFLKLEFTTKDNGGNVQEA